jgi:hypothetical protein
MIPIAGRRSFGALRSAAILLAMAPALVFVSCKASSTAELDLSGGSSEPTLEDGAGEAAADPATGEAVEATAPLPTSEAAAAATAEAAALLPPVLFTFGKVGTDPGQMTLPFDVAADAEGQVYVSDSTGVSKYSEEGEFILRVGEGELPMAEGLAVGPDGLLYVTGYGALVQVYDAEGTFVRTLGDAGELPPQLKKPTDIVFDSQGNLLIADAGNRQIKRFSRDGRFLSAIGEPGTMNGQFTAPRNLAIDAEDRLYVGAGDDFLVQRFSPSGEYQDSFGLGSLDETLFRTAGIAVDSEKGIAYLSQSVSHFIQAFDLGETPPRILWQLGGHPGTNRGQFNSPSGIELIGDRLYVADKNNHRIQVLDLR